MKIRSTCNTQVMPLSKSCGLLFQRGCSPATTFVLGNECFSHAAFRQSEKRGMPGTEKVKSANFSVVQRGNALGDHLFSQCGAFDRYRKEHSGVRSCSNVLPNKLQIAAAIRPEFS